MATSKSWKRVRGELVERGEIDESEVHKLTDQMRSAVRMHRLAEIRESFGISQQVLAERMGVSQARISQIERGELDRTEVATLRRYLSELGGEIEICVWVGDDRLQIA